MLTVGPPPLLSPNIMPAMMNRSFHPPRRILMGPGPSDVHPRVLEALARPTIGHLDPAFVELMGEIKTLLQHAFQTKNAMTFPVSGPGTAGMESCFANLVEPGDTVIVCRNGYFGHRMQAMALRCGAEVVTVDAPWGRALDPHNLDDELAKHPAIRLVAFVHAETSTGVLSDAQALAEVARRHNCLTLVDAVTSFAGSPLDVDAWGLDAVYTGSQKCLSCIPGISPLTFSDRAVQAVRARKIPVQSWFMDLTEVEKYWGEGKPGYHHTAPINSLYALHVALLMLQKEGLEPAWARHRLHHEALRAGLESLGMTFIVPEAERTPQLNAVSVPEGVNEAKVRRRLLDEHGLEIGGGLGDFAGQIWRIGLMGYSSRAENILKCIEALEAVLQEEGVDIAAGRAVDEAERVLAEAPLV